MVALANILKSGHPSVEPKFASVNNPAKKKYSFLLPEVDKIDRSSTTYITNDDINDMPFTTLLSAQIAEW